MHCAGRQTLALIFMLLSAVQASACTSRAGDETSAKNSSNNIASRYVWTEVTDRAEFSGAYNFPVFVMRGEMWAFHPEGNWRSSDGRDWTRSELPLAGLNSAYQKYVQFGDGVYALGAMEGNYTNMRLSSRIVRTKDFKSWETLAAESNLPARVFYAAVVFQNKIWLMGGYDGKRYYNDVWNSADGVRWQKVTEHAAWSPRNIGGAGVVFKDRIFLIGGGVIDGERDANPRAGHEIWSSADGVNWTLVTDRTARGWGGTPVVFDDKLWLVGANREGNFSRAVLVSADGASWQEESAAWSPRGAAAAWVFDDKLYITGGKYSETVNGEIKFIYSNDVWRMTPVQSRPAQTPEECEWCGASDAPSNLSSRTVIPPANEPGEPLVISGTVFKEDGKTPAEGVLLYVYHTNAAGLYPKRTPNDGRPQWRHGYLRGWMRTGRDGRYEFRTIKPAAYPTRDEPAHIHLTISAANHPEYSATIWFADDPLITPELRAHNDAIVATRTMRPAAILTLRRDAGGVLHGTHDIRLGRVTN